MSLRDELLSVDDTVYESVAVPEWGGKVVWLRSPGSRDRDAFEASLLTKEGKGRKARHVPSLDNIKAKLVVRCVCEGQGVPALVFTPGDADTLALKNAAAVSRLYEVAQRLCGITDDDVEELTGN